jgi:2-keto-myo-inositol isomerase
MLITWNGETVPTLPLDAELDVVSAAGYDGIELFIPKLAPFLEGQAPEDLARRLGETGLVPIMLNGIENFNLRSADEFAAITEDCRWLSELSQEIGCPGIVVVPSPNPKGLDWQTVKSKTSAALRELAGVANPYGVQLGLEFLAPVDCSVRTLAEAWEIVEAAGRENLGLVLDTYHFCVGGSGWESLEVFPVDRLLLVHINDVEDLPFEQLTDGHRLLPGEGILPLGRILSSVCERGYDGAYSLEVMRPAYHQRKPLEYAQAGLEATRAVLQTAASPQSGL